MIVEDDQGADPDPLRAQRSGRIGHQQQLAAQPLEGAHRGGHHLHGLVFVVVAAPLHADHVHPVQLAEHQLAAVARHSADREAIQLLVGDGDLLLQRIGQHAEAGAQDHGGAGGKPRLAGENGGDGVEYGILLHELHLLRL
ncbi:hypothetical protein D3C73_811070 [compost metagenome]